MIVRKVLCASDLSTIVSSKRTIIGGLRIRIRLDDGKLHGQTPRSAVEGDGPHAVIQQRNNNVAHAPVTDGKRETRLLIFFHSVVAPGNQYCCNDVRASQADRFPVQSPHVGLDIER